MFASEPRSGVRVDCVFVRRRGMAGEMRDVLVGILPHCSPRDFSQLLQGNDVQEHSWVTLHLRGPAAPYTDWPEVDMLFAVTTGGIDPDLGDTGRQQFVDGVFTDRALAQACADACGDGATHVQSVPLSRRLAVPSPAWAPTPTELNRFAELERAAIAASTDRLPISLRGEVRYAIEGPDWNDIEVVPR